jgi:RNA polymerase sigma-70 factor (ECF subfamily)
LKLKTEVGLLTVTSEESVFIMQEDQVSIHQLFQKEFAKMVAVISKLYGLACIEQAEDIVSETFLVATESWEKSGPPENPTAWLYKVAKQKTLSYFRRDKIFRQKIVPEIAAARKAATGITEEDFSRQNIKDSQLRMMFAICNPAIASEAQIGLALRVLCGFGIDEIAEAFLTGRETIHKRLFRAKQKLRTENISMELPDDREIDSRLDSVLHIIYLLFNEGYYSSTQNQVLRKELCFEALSLGLLLTEFPATNRPKTNALIALMCFHSSRFAARVTPGNQAVLYDSQDEKLWDNDLILRGKYFLDLSSEGADMSPYHLEAGIAYWHCQKEDSSEKWESILQLYNLLLQINYSPTAALNRTYALSKARGKSAAIPEAEKLHALNNHFYFTLMGELYTDMDDGKAQTSFEKALLLARTQADKEAIQARMEKLRNR